MQKQSFNRCWTCNGKPVTLPHDAQITEKRGADVGGGELLAFGSANPCTEEQYHAGSFTTYYGRSLAIIRAGEARTVKISASDGRESASAQIRIM